MTKLSAADYIAHCTGPRPQAVFARGVTRGAGSCRASFLLSPPRLLRHTQNFRPIVRCSLRSGSCAKCLSSPTCLSDRLAGYSIAAGSLAGWLAGWSLAGGPRAGTLTENRCLGSGGLWWALGAHRCFPRKDRDSERKRPISKDPGLVIIVVAFSPLSGPVREPNAAMTRWIRLRSLQTVRIDENR
jgi:hypothetical protein